MTDMKHQVKTIYEKLAICQSAGEVKRMIKGNGHVIAPKTPTREILRAAVLPICEGRDPVLEREYDLAFKVYRCAMEQAALNESNDN